MSAYADTSFLISWHTGDARFPANLLPSGRRQIASLRCRSASARTRGEYLSAHLNEFLD